MQKSGGLGMTQIVYLVYELKLTAYCEIHKELSDTLLYKKMKKSISPKDGFSRDMLSISGLDGVDILTS